MTRYPKYKNSGIDWIGEIPSHWEVKRIKYVTKNYDAKRIPLSSDQRGLKRGNYPYYGATGIIDYVDEFIFEGKYVLIGEDGAPFFIANRDVSFVANGKFWVNNHAHILECYVEMNPEILCHQLNLVDYRKHITGSTRDKLTQEDLKEISVIQIPKEEQTIIANFLDEKSTQIDKLIINKEKLIELLKEERTVIINEAVSGKGKNWEKKKLKYIALIKYGLGQPPKQKDDGLPLIRATNVERGKINEKNLVFVDPDDVPYDRDPVLRENDIIVVRSGAYTADSAIIPKKFDGAITGYDMVVRVVKDNPFYIAFCLLSDDILIGQLYLQKLRAAQPHLNKEELGETLFNMPPLKDQTEIVKHIQTETQRIDNTISKIEKETELMNEYRTALISEVVTGKIKVN